MASLVLENLCDDYPLNKIMYYLLIEDIITTMLVCRLFYRRISATELYQILFSVARPYVAEQFRDDDNSSYAFFRTKRSADIYKSLFSHLKLKANPASDLFINACSRGRVALARYSIKRYGFDSITRETIYSGFTLAIVENQFDTIYFLMHEVMCRSKFELCLLKALEYDNKSDCTIRYQSETMIRLTEYTISEQQYRHKNRSMRSDKRDTINTLKSLILYCLAHSDLTTAQLVYCHFFKKFSLPVSLNGVQKKMLYLVWEKQFKDPNRSITKEILQWFYQIVGHENQHRIRNTACLAAFNNERYDVLDWLDSKVVLNRMLTSHIEINTLIGLNYRECPYYVTNLLVTVVVNSLCFKKDVNIQLLKKIESLCGNAMNYLVFNLLSLIHVAVDNCNTVCVDWLLSLIDVERAVESDDKYVIIGLLSDDFSETPEFNYKIQTVLYRIFGAIRGYDTPIE